jgi:hypothetical protein
MKIIINLLILVFLFSCNNSNRNGLKSILEEKVKFRGNLSSSEFGDYEYNDIIGSIKLDTFPKNLSLKEFFGRKGNQYEIKILDTEKISFPYPKELNNVKICCEYDTTSIFIESIGEKKYIIIPHYDKGKEWYQNITFNDIFEIIDPKSNYIKKRNDIDLPMWGLKIGDYIDKNLIDTSIDIRPEEEQNIRHQFLKSDKSIEISTLEFENSNKVLITHIKKNDLKESEFNEFIDYIKSNYPFLIIENRVDNVTSITKTNFFRINYFGLSIEFQFSEINFTDRDIKSYSFEISDSYTITKRIIENEGKKFLYNQGNKYVNK